MTRWYFASFRSKPGASGNVGHQLPSFFRRAPYTSAILSDTCRRHTSTLAEQSTIRWLWTMFVLFFQARKKTGARRTPSSERTPPNERDGVAAQASPGGWWIGIRRCTLFPSFVSRFLLFAFVEIDWDGASLSLIRKVIPITTVVLKRLRRELGELCVRKTQWRKTAPYAPVAQDVSIC